MVYPRAKNQARDVAAMRQRSNRFNDNAIAAIAGLLAWIIVLRAAVG
jgi:hypothetical protein